MSGRELRRVASRWQALALICRKCSKRLKGGFGPDGDQHLAKALRRHLAADDGHAKGRKARLGVVQVSCLGICPRRGVVMIRSSAPGEWLIVPPGMSLDEVEALLTAGPPAQRAAVTD
ncbi:(2Fe-2S) ferredoxin domain-containing protein [Geminicoccus flavidas]|uniref:(2Fe-2S) ferredoxin domain-containing protein n=1 Tax=Geminicoccus flavidas TaxID=2506407 RepID=UPI00135A4534|nr:(2Fe-2S) ferredoxin domain-containing protein [Geminicoccus flavidas]